ncbi:MAG: hypothetical protein ABW212_02610, partial [Pseudonocardia sediminis]
RLRAACLGLTPMVEADAWAHAKARWHHGGDDRGADLVFQTRADSASLHAAMQALRPQGTVIDLAFYTGDAAALDLGAEFHHNGLGIRSAQIGRVPRGTAHLWDRERLSAETIAFLRHTGGRLREHLITDVVPLEAGPALLTDLAARRRHTVQAVLAFDDQA